jgi:G3E family GTPase
MVMSKPTPLSHTFQLHRLTPPPEFGNTTDLEKPLTVSSGSSTATEWLNLANGCICCSVKDSGVNALESLMERNGAFDYILLETTGLADPGNIAPVFWVDEGLGSTIYLDGIVTLADAANLVRSLEEPVGDEAIKDDDQASHDHDHKHKHTSPQLSIAHLQISHADVIILNKTDLVSPSELVSVEARIRSINSLATIIQTTQSRVPALEGSVLDLHAYDRVQEQDLDAAFASKGHSHLDSAIGTLTVRIEGEIGEEALRGLDGWLRSVLWESKVPGREEVTGWEIHRAKGRVRVVGGGVKMLQGVREIFELIDGVVDDGGEDAAEGKEQGGRIVFIGRNVSAEATATAFQQSLDLALGVDAGRQ